jgi:hypothetical protein
MLLSSLWSIPEFNYEEGVDAYPPFMPTLPEAPVGVPEEPLFYSLFVLIFRFIIFIIIKFEFY